MLLLLLAGAAAAEPARRAEAQAQAAERLLILLALAAAAAVACCRCRLALGAGAALKDRAQVDGRRDILNHDVIVVTSLQVRVQLSVCCCAGASGAAQQQARRCRVLLRLGKRLLQVHAVHADDTPKPPRTACAPACCSLALISSLSCLGKGAGAAAG